MNVLELSTATITQYLKPFRGQLSTLSNLAEFEVLKPYITIPSSKKSAENDSSSDESSPPYDGDEHIPTNPRRQRAVLPYKVFPYPLTEAQEAVLEHFRQAHTLKFISLPSADCIMKLIALSVQVSEPYYEQVLFPNVEKVIFSSTMQEKSVDERYASLINDVESLPHPITFALNWLVYEFSLCIHSASSTFRNNWINTQIKNDQSSESKARIREIYQNDWNLMNPLSGTISLERIDRLRSISYHNILPGDQPAFNLKLNHKVDTYLYFGQHQGCNDADVEMTMGAIAEPLLHAMSLGSTFNQLHLVEIEYLENATMRKFGPKGFLRRVERRMESIKKIFGLVQDLARESGVPWNTVNRRRLSATIGSEDYKQFGTVVCQCCGEHCDELCCSTSHFPAREVPLTL
jgi:hypothetical protein